MTYDVLGFLTDNAIVIISVLGCLVVAQILIMLFSPKERIIIQQPAPIQQPTQQPVIIQQQPQQQPVRMDRGFVEVSSPLQQFTGFRQDSRKGFCFENGWDIR